MTKTIDINRLINKVSAYHDTAESLIKSYKKNIAEEKAAVAEYSSTWNSNNFKAVADRIAAVELEIKYQEGRLFVLGEILRDLTIPKETK